MLQQLRYFCGCEYHFDHSTQPVLTRVWDGSEAERLFSPGNRAEHLGRPGDWPLGRHEDQLDHGTGRKERSQYHQAAGQGNALQFRWNPVSIEVAKDNGDRLRQLKPLRTRSCLGLGDLNHWHPVCAAFPIIRRSRRGWYCFRSHLGVQAIPQLSRWRTKPRRLTCLGATSEGLAPNAARSRLPRGIGPPPGEFAVSRSGEAYNPRTRSPHRKFCVASQSLLRTRKSYVPPLFRPRLRLPPRGCPP